MPGEFGKINGHFLKIKLTSRNPFNPEDWCQDVWGAGSDSCPKVFQ